MKKGLVLITFFFLLINMVWAQLPEGGDIQNGWKKRMGTVSPAKATTLYSSVFGASSPILRKEIQDSLLLKFYIEELKPLMDLAPYCDYRIYAGNLFEDSTSLYRRLLNSCTDPAVRMMFVDDVVKIGDTFVSNMDSINVLREENPATKGDPLTEAMAKIRRAHCNYLFAHNPKYYPSHLYDKEKIYNLYREAFLDFVKSKEQAGKELHAFYVKEYFDVCLDLYKSDEEKYYAQFLNDYLEVINVCDKLLLPYDTVPTSLKNDVTKQEYSIYRDYNDITNNYKIEFKGDTIVKGRLIEYYDTIPYGIKPLFKASNAANHARLNKYFSHRLDEHRNDTSFLASAVHLMFQNGFLNNKTFYDYCKASYDLCQNYENCIGIGLGTNKDSVSQKRQYFLDALKIAQKGQNMESVVLAHYLIAISSYQSPKSYILFKEKDGKKSANRDSKTLKLEMTEDYKTWETEMHICNSNAREIIKLTDKIRNSSKRTIKDYPAQSYYMIAFNLRWKGYIECNVPLLEEAKQNMEIAKELAIETKVINGIGVNIDEQLRIIGEDIEKCKKIIKQRKADAHYQAIKQQEYEEYQRKKQAEEDFWNQR